MTAAARLPTMSARCGKLAIVRFAVPRQRGTGDDRLHHLHRRRRGEEQRAQVRPAPHEAAADLRCLDAPDALAGGIDDPDPTWTRRPHVAERVALHAVDVALGHHTAADLVEEHPAVRQRAVGSDVVHLDLATWRVVHVEQRLVRCEAQAVGLLELVRGDDELGVAGTGKNTVDALEVAHELTLAPDPVVPAAVVRVGEVDAAVARTHDHVVRAVEVRPLMVPGDELVQAVAMDARHTARQLLTDQQAAVEVERQAVALERRPGDTLHAALRRPSPAGVAGDVAEQQRLVADVPHRTLAELVAGADLGHARVGIDELGELR